MTMKKLPQTADAGVLGKPAALNFTGLGPSQFDELVAIGIDAGGLPAPIRITPDGRTVGWVRDELITWMKERIKARDAAPPKDKKKSKVKA
jgi:predicted DNA-binding transcriptional regulator AlpA